MLANLTDKYFEISTVKLFLKLTIKWDNNLSNQFFW